MPVDFEKEKKKNVKLAIGVAAIGILFFAFIYALMFTLMFLKPGLIFSMMPFPSLSREIVPLNEKLYVISKEVDLSGVSFESKKQPDEKFMLGILENNNISAIQSIKPFYSYAQSGNKIYFFGKGFFRTFDGAQWTETKTDAIGKNPKAAANAESIWVLSGKKDNKILNQIKGDAVSPLPLPAGYAEDKEICTGSANLVLFEDRLYIFWTSKNLFYSASYDGKAWNVSEPSEHPGKIKAIADDKGIYLFSEGNEAPEISLATYENGRWNEAGELGVSGLFIAWTPFINKGNPFLLVRGFFSETLYTIENNKAVNPVKFKSGLSQNGVIWKIALLIIFGNLVFFVFVYLLSLFINRFKLRTWEPDSRQYEFASLFRRFLAKTLDSIIIMLPPAVFFSIYFLSSDFQFHPLKIFLFMFLAFGYLILGNLIYHWLLEGIYGKTLGKKLCGIIVLKDDFTKCGLLSGFLRNILRIADNFFYYLVGLISMTGTLKWQRLGDVVAGTVVVREKKS